MDAENLPEITIRSGITHTGDAIEVDGVVPAPGRYRVAGTDTVLEVLPDWDGGDGDV